MMGQTGMKQDDIDDMGRKFIALVKRLRRFVECVVDAGEKLKGDKWKDAPIHNIGARNQTWGRDRSGKAGVPPLDMEGWLSREEFAKALDEWRDTLPRVQAYRDRMSPEVQRELPPLP